MPAQWSVMQSSSQNELGVSHSREPHASSAATRAAGEHSGSSSFSFSSVHFSGNSLSSGTAHTSRSDASNITSLLGSGCSAPLQLCHASSSSGGVTSNPPRSGICCASCVRPIAGPLVSTSIDPQSSISNDSPTVRMVTQSGLLVFKLTATFTAHDAPTAASPHGH